MPKSSNQTNREPKKKTIYKRNFWRLHKWKIVFTIIPIIFFVMFSSILIFEAKIFEDYKKTIVVREYEQSSTYYYVYVVDDIEYIAATESRSPNNESQTTNGHGEIWYSVKDPQNYILARNQLIITFATADFIIIAWVVIHVGYSYINRKKSNQKHSRKMRVL